MSDKVKIKLKTDLWDGPKLLKEGSTIEVDNRTSRELIGNGSAEAVVAKAEKETTK